MSVSKDTLQKMRRHLDNNMAVGVPIVELKDTFDLSYGTIKKYVKLWGYVVQKKKIITERKVLVVMQKR